jgi:hypothetical protein
LENQKEDRLKKYRIEANQKKDRMKKYLMEEILSSLTFCYSACHISIWIVYYYHLDSLCLLCSKLQIQRNFFSEFLKPSNFFASVSMNKLARFCFTTAATRITLQQNPVADFPVKFRAP